VVCLLAASTLRPATAAQTNSPAVPAQTEVTPAEIVQFLGNTIDWYRQAQQEQHIATEPEDLGFSGDNRRMADQIVKLAFEFARQQEQQLAKRPAAQTSSNPSDASSRVENLSRQTAKADALVQQTQTELQSLKNQLATIPASKRPHLQTQIAEVQSELGLFQARQQALHNMLDFAGGASKAGGTSLRAQIDELARAVPAALSSPNSDNAITAEAPSSSKPNDSLVMSTPNGMWALAADLFRLSGKRGVLSSSLRATEQLDSTSKDLRAPLVGRLKQLIQTGDQITQQADTSDQNALLQEKAQLDELTVQFKQVSALMSSLGKQRILLDFYKRSLTNWREEVDGQFKERLKGLLLRAFGLAIALGAVLLIGEFWRRAIFRYVHDTRRRYQFMLMRKIALWSGVAIVLLFSFVTELGAVATFAGLITAGVAVALQNVIVSIVGYFFLIGKYGIRVGDRVQVGTVTGEVVDIGLVRFHLMELSGGVTDSEPTGRIVAFSNSVVFQSTGGLFKQIPGTSFVWREITLRFALDSDYREIRERLQRAMNTALGDFTDFLDRQRRQMELSISSVPTSELKPRMRTHFTSSATEVTIRYPVVAEKSSEIDERIMGEVFSAIERDPKLKLLDSQVSTLQVGK
jgi:small-conductance mechanosensitive channel